MFKKKCLRSLTSTSKKLSPSFWCTITLKSIALQGLFIDSLWNAHTNRKKLYFWIRSIYSWNIDTLVRNDDNECSWVVLMRIFTIIYLTFEEIKSSLVLLLRSLTSTSKKLSPSFWWNITLKSIALQVLFIGSLWSAHTNKKNYISEYD